MEILPQDLHKEILSRLPIRSLLRFKCVCRAWQALIEDPSFANLHLSRSKHNSTATHLIFLQKKASKLLLDLDFAIDETNPPHYENVIFIQHRLQFHPDSSTSIIVSCNGLLCFPRFLSTEILCVWNPITGEYISLPPLPPLEPNTFYYYGIGFDSTMSMGEYKVVVICSNQITRHAEAAICSLKGSLSWRFLRGIPYHLSSNEYKGLFVDGALYWWMDVAHSGIVAMDLRRENFHVINLSVPGNMIEWEGCLGVLQNHPVTRRCGSERRYVIRVLKGYPPKEEGMKMKSWFWSKVVCTNWDLLSQPSYAYYYPICAQRKDDVLIVDSLFKQLVSYNLENRSGTRLKSIWSPGSLASHLYRRPMIYVPSLVRLGIKNE